MQGKKIGKRTETKTKTKKKIEESWIIKIERRKKGLRPLKESDRRTIGRMEANNEAEPTKIPEYIGLVTET